APKKIFREVLSDKRSVRVDFLPVKSGLGWRSHHKGTYLNTCIDDEWDQRRDTDVGKCKCNEFVESKHHGQEQHENRLEAPERRQPYPYAESDRKRFFSGGIVAVQQVLQEKATEPFFTEGAKIVARPDIKQRHQHEPRIEDADACKIADRPEVRHPL